MKNIIDFMELDIVKYYDVKFLTMVELFDPKELDPDCEIIYNPSYHKWLYDDGDKNITILLNKIIRLQRGLFETWALKYNKEMRFDILVDNFEERKIYLV